MNGEEITKVAGGVVDGLKHQPALLVIVVLNVIMLTAQVWDATSTTKSRNEVISKLIDQCGPRQDPGRTGSEIPLPINPPAINVKKE